MITYIKNNVEGYYITYPYELDETYWEGKIGYTFEDFENGKWVALVDEQLQYKEEHPDATVEEVFKMKPIDNHRTIADAKNQKHWELDNYDSSENVNSFTVTSGGNSITSWFTPEQRSNYKSSIDAAELTGIDTLQLYIADTPVTISTSDAKMMLAQIQLYADRCYIVTKQHSLAIDNLDTVEAVDAYDFTAGYPEKLTFNL